MRTSLFPLARVRAAASWRRAWLAVPLAAMLLAPRVQTRDRTLFADEFSGNALDRAKWNVIVTGRTVNNEQQAYVDSPDVLAVGDGHLTIHPRFQPGFKTP